MKRSPVERSCEPVLAHRCMLGEGPVWDARERRLIFVDILDGLVHSVDPTTAELETLAVGEPVGAAVPRERGGLVLATRSGFALVDPRDRRITPLREIDEGPIPGNRMNDGKCDARGRFWAGTQSDESERRAGGLYRLEADGSATRVLGGIGISNGLDWSEDGRTFYFIDTPTRAIDAFDFDPEPGALSRRRRVVEIPAEHGLPDGMTIDAEGGLWVAMFGGSAVHRYAPDGSLDRVVSLPVSLVTSCAFGGPDLDELYVTSAAHRLSAPEPLAGSLFRLSPGTHGRPAWCFAG